MCGWLPPFLSSAVTHPKPVRDARLSRAQVTGRGPRMTRACPLRKAPSLPGVGVPHPGLQGPWALGPMPPFCPNPRGFPHLRLWPRHRVRIPGAQALAPHGRRLCPCQHRCPRLRARRVDAPSAGGPRVPPHPPQQPAGFCKAWTPTAHPGRRGAAVAGGGGSRPPRACGRGHGRVWLPFL